jgi:ankyrin repeat protein
MEKVMCVVELVGERNADINARDDNGNTALIVARNKRSSENGVINARDDNGNTNYQLPETKA